ncbi:MAG: hypothetical protein WCO93_02860 [bacterium]
MSEQPINPIFENRPEPSVSGAFGHGWETMKKNFPELLLVIFLQILIAVPVGIGNFFLPVPPSFFNFSSLFSIVYGLVVLTPVSYGCYGIFLKAVRGESYKVTDMFFAFQQIWQIIIANLLVGLIVGAGFVLLIVPGIIFACKLAFVPFLVIDKKLDAAEAIRQSWSMTRGFTGTIFLMGLISCFIALAGIICLFVGIFPAVIWIELAFAGIYWIVSEKIASGTPMAQ